MKLLSCVVNAQLVATHKSCSVFQQGTNGGFLNHIAFEIEFRSTAGIFHKKSRSIYHQHAAHFGHFVSGSPVESGVLRVGLLVQNDAPGTRFQVSIPFGSQSKQ